MKKLGTLISKVATPIARTVGSKCVDKKTGELKPKSTCAKVRDHLDAGRYKDAFYDRFFDRARKKTQTEGDKNEK